jgi:endonuclease/exonuclease/phosphatase family metal-dependent hydrolase
MKNPPRNRPPRTLRSMPPLPRALLLTLALITATADASGPTPLTIDVLTFNTALLPEIAASTEQAERARAMAPALIGYDVLALQELFINRYRDALLAELADTYPHRSDLVGRDGARDLPWRQDGGIIILSRHPIERRATLTFDDVCAGTDCLADKGVAYAAIRIADRLIHVFATHAQSSYGGARAPGIRAAQFALLRDFIAAQQIPHHEVVIIAGDLNVDAWSAERDAMLALLAADWPPLRGELRYTWDPERNAFATPPAGWLDYVLLHRDHAPVRSAWNQALPLRAGDLDLSDHFAVWARITLP